MNQWFEVDREGLKALYKGKDKFFIIKELVQNAWDENTTTCQVDLEHNNGVAEIKVTDDSPEGFKNLAHAYTLFADTYKRRDPTKRGRFNLGEKQVLAICKTASIATTKGTIIFDEQGRRELTVKRSAGSQITIEVEMTAKEFDRLFDRMALLLPPTNIKFIVNGSVLEAAVPVATFFTTLTTEVETNGQMVRTERKTMVNLYDSKEPWLYEMGIPVVPIECKYSVDIQQKIPLGIDRESVIPSFLPDLYAEILNNTINQLSSEESSQPWVRAATADKRCKTDTVKKVITKRYGDKVVVASPNDPNSIDDAIAAGYNVVYGSELSKQEWEKIREADAIPSSTQLFGHSLADATIVEPTPNMRVVELYAKRLANYLLDADIKVRFIKLQNAAMAAEYGNRTLIFVTNKLTSYFRELNLVDVTDLILHELAHEYGNHTEAGYHKALSKFGAKLAKLALEEPEFFEELVL